MPDTPTGFFLVELAAVMCADPAYLLKAEPHRVAVLADWRLYASTSLG